MGAWAGKYKLGAGLLKVGKGQGPEVGASLQTALPSTALLLAIGLAY
jgi:hypothetical protein